MPHEYGISKKHQSLTIAKGVHHNNQISNFIMKMQSSLLWITFAMTITNATAQPVYRCVEAGKVVFSDKVCGVRAESINVKPASGASSTKIKTDSSKALNTPYLHQSSRRTPPSHPAMQFNPGSASVTSPKSRASEGYIPMPVVPPMVDTPPAPPAEIPATPAPSASQSVF